MSSQMRGLYDEVEVEVWVNNIIQHTADIPSLNKSKEHPDPLNPLGDLPPESTGSHSESSRGRSPSKRLPPKLSPTKGRDQLSDRASDYTSEFTLQSKRNPSKSPTHGNKNMAHLEICNPPILRKSVQACKREMKGQLPKLVDDLVNDLYYNAPSGCIPLKLRASKEHYERLTTTPKKSEKSLHPSDFLDEQSHTELKSHPELKPPFQNIDVKELPHFVESILKAAQSNADKNAHERHWSLSAVEPLLQKILEWGYRGDIRVLNVEQVAIRPKEVQLKSPSDTPMVFNSASNASTIEETETTMIDMQYGFWLSEDDKGALRQRYPWLAEDERSINQTTAAFTKDVPTFVDFKLETRGAEDPKVQLAVWGAGLYLKRKQHEWDVSMPIVGVTIESHIWQCFLLFESGDGLTMMGPISLGDTGSRPGVFRILFSLEYFAAWGVQIWKPWFNRTVMDWMRGKSGEESEQFAEP